MQLALKPKAEGQDSSPLGIKNEAEAGGGAAAASISASASSDRTPPQSEESNLQLALKPEKGEANVAGGGPSLSNNGAALTLRTIKDAGCLKVSQSPDFTRGSLFLKRGWLGGSVFKALINKMICEPGRGYPDDFNSQQDIAKLANRSRVLEQIYEDVAVRKVLGLSSNLRSREKVDVMEVVISDLDDAKHVPECRDMLDIIAAKAITEGMVCKRAREKDNASHAVPDEIREHYRWLKRYEYQGQGYTHTSLKGGRDKCTSTGKLRLPDNTQTQVRLAKAVADCFEAGSFLLSPSFLHFPCLAFLSLLPTLRK